MNKLRQFLIEWLSDTMWYLLVPLLAQLLPLFLAEKFLGFLSARSWCLRSFAMSALHEAQKHVEINDPERWLRQFKLVRMGEAYDLFYYQIRRGSALKRFPGLTEKPQWPQCVLGLHWGVGLSILKLIHETGGKPRIVMRKVEPGFWKVRPGFYLYMQIMVRFIHRCCYGREIPVPGGIREIKQQNADETLVFLTDVPTVSKRRFNKVSLNQTDLCFDSGGLKIVANMKISCAWYSVGIGESALTRQLQLSDFIQSPEQEVLEAGAAEQVNKLVSLDSAQWQMWPYLSQFVL